MPADWTPPVSRSLQILAMALQTWAMAVNPFFSSVIRLQSDRGHHVITRGPYRFVRHPGYFAMLAIMPATAVALGSLAALAPAILYDALILRRTLKEDEFLVKNLSGYCDYATRVSQGLIPGLW